ncbi:MAG: hypothetical protein SFX73_30580 [Kofleriaceae bacterium]|nr:hypothetical protein [Kofleriaceae bacterium]
MSTCKVDGGVPRARRTRYGVVVLACTCIASRSADAQTGEPPPAAPAPAPPVPPESPPPPQEDAHAPPMHEVPPHEGQHGHDDEDARANSLALQLTNPVADLASLPFQFNWNNGLGPNDSLQMVLNIQPVVPVHLSKNWNLIGRYIVPLIGQPSLDASQPATFGMGDITFSLFLSPSKPSKFIWGVGPVFGLPGGTDPALNSGKWLIGPTAVGLYLHAPWTIGALVNQQWSFADTSDFDSPGVSQLFVQPFVSFTKHSWTLTAQSEMTFNWKADDDKASIPLELLGSRLTKIGFLPFSVQVGGGWFAATPDNGPDWRLRLNFVVLLPNEKLIKAALMKK